MKPAVRMVTCLVLVLAAACGRGPPGAPAATGPGTDIAWFEGDVAAAFRASQAQGKPLLLYWGAEWCPYCRTLQATVFTDTRFVEQSRLFVPVYLDGDLPDAQRQAEELRVSGYPTLLVLDSDRRELARISGGLDLRQYAGLLDQALQDGRPVEAVLASLGNPAQAPADLAAACRRVAWNAWGLGEEFATGSAQLARQLRDAATACRDIPGLELRLLAFAATAGTAAPPGTAPVDAELPGRLGTLMQTDTAADDHDALAYLAPDFLALLARTEPEMATALATRFIELMRQAADSERLTRADQLGALYAALQADTAAGLGDAGGLRETTRLRIATEQERLPDDPYLRAGVINGMVGLMTLLGAHEDAYQLVRREIDGAPGDYYLMSTLAGLSESLGRHDEALQWYDQAFQHSRGAATRVQWGTNHARAVLRLAPDDMARVRAASLAAIGELQASQGLYRRSRGRMARLETALQDWSHGASARAALLPELAQAYRSACPEDCAPFLATSPQNRE